MNKIWRGLCTLSVLAVAACAPPAVRGTFQGATVERKKVEFPIGRQMTAEVGEALYEQGDLTTTKTRTAELLASVSSTLDLGHRLNLPAGVGGPLQTRSENGAFALCFPTSGVGQAVTTLIASGTTIACLIDEDKDGTFDYSMFATREKYFPLSAKTPYSVKVIEQNIETKGALRIDFMYQGFARGVLRFSYREFRDGLARPAFTQDLTYEADGTAKTARFSAKGLQAQRSRLDLSAADFGTLLGVSAQSIYNWESEKARPRAEQIAKLAAVRSLGKREVAARLELLTD